jgi:hypothetical protein
MFQAIRARLAAVAAAIRARMVDDARQALSWWSVRANALGILLMPLIVMVPTMPAEVQGLFPLKLRAGLAGAYSLLAIVLRLAAQKKPNG